MDGKLHSFKCSGKLKVEHSPEQKEKIEKEKVDEKAEKENPELIIMDLSLPILNGWDAAKRLKKNNKTMSIPIIALTAHAMKGDKEKAINAGCDDYDTKPVDFERLLMKINKVANL